MTTDKEELRKEFVEELRKGITFAGQIGDYVINQSLFDWLNSKLQAKDKEIAELDEQLQLYHTLITDLKAEIERLKGDKRKYCECGGRRGYIINNTCGRCKLPIRV